MSPNRKRDPLPLSSLVLTSMVTLDARMVAERESLEPARMPAQRKLDASAQFRQPCGLLALG